MSSTGQSTPSPSNFQLIVNALADYAEQTEIDLAKNPFSEKVKFSNSPEAILELLQEAFKQYREGNRRLIRCLSPAVEALHALSGILGEAVSLVSRGRRRTRCVRHGNSSAALVLLDSVGDVV